MSKKREVIITKSSGEQEVFNPEKYLRSLKRSGLSTQEANMLLNKIQPYLVDGLTTHKIYDITFDLLKKSNRKLASRYSLKDALRRLGPTGFPFEQLVERILQFRGYKTKRDYVMQGRCITHEIDVFAQDTNQNKKNENKNIIVECKFHHHMGLRSAVQTCLYMYARCQDISAVQKDIDGCLLVTNTQFTSEAITYGECVGLMMLAWGYPRNNGLEKHIDTFKLYPITTLTELKRLDRERLFKANIVTCADLVAHEQNLTVLGIRAFVARNLVHEARALLE